MARFDQPHASSDGGAVLLKAVDDRLGLTARLSEAIGDPRQSGKISHSVADLLRQRVFGLACGYADCDDAARLTNDPVHKLVVGRDPLSGEPLGSQPTLSRFENAVATRDRYRLGTSLAGTVLDFHQTRLAGAARLITLDVDATADPTHGQQQFAFLNAFYDTWCHLPLLATVAFNDERHQYLVAALLRPGTGAATRGVRGLLRRLVDELRARFPRTGLRVRLDAGFAHPKLLDWLEAAGLEYVIGVPSNPRLAKRVRRLLGRARVLARATGETIPLYGETRYAARKWSRRRRIIMKAEALRYPGRATKDNCRFVVTNLRFSPTMVYAIDCERGDMENRIKELKDGLAMDRTSCSRFGAKQLRLLLAAAAFVLFQTIQTYAHGTVLADAQVSTLRDRLLKVAVRIERSARRIVLHLPQYFPSLAPWRPLAAAVGATSGPPRPYGHRGTPAPVSPRPVDRSSAVASSPRHRAA